MLTLMNFKIPAQTKKQFAAACRERNVAMTSILNEAIVDFIKTHREDKQALDADEPLAFFRQ